MNLREIKRHVGALSARQLVKLDAWIHGLLETTADVGGSKAAGEHRVSRRTYQHEMVRCGKKGCRCARGELHGPYWYAYWTEGGKTRSQYVGKKLSRKRKICSARRD